MLKSITLENYKCFKDRTTIDIAPLTVLCGVNSSGKSSILKSLLMMKQTVEKDTPYNQLSFIGKYVDNGYFHDIINFSSEEDTFTISNTFTISKFEEGSRKRQDMISYKELKKLFYFVKNINAFKIMHSVTVKKPDDEKTNYELMGYIENNRIVKTFINVKLLDYNNQEINDIDCIIQIKKTNDNERSYDLFYYNLPVFGRLQSNATDIKKTFQCYFNNIKLTNIFQRSMNKKNINAKSTILSLFDIASIQYSGISFIAPLRQFPMRNYSIQGNLNSVGISGEDAPVLYAKLSADEKYMVDISFPECNINNINNFTINFKTNIEPISYKSNVQKWMDYFELGDINVSGNEGLVSLKINNHNISDVGFGVSQVFPIIVQGLQMPKDSVLLLEQPEIHLHPQMQMRMADFLLSLSSSERNVIVETHSDHIINRLVRRLMEDDTEKLQNIVKIYFLENKGNGVTISEIKTDKIKGVVDAPVQFFGQYAVEINDIMKVGFKNIKARKMNNE